MVQVSLDWCGFNLSDEWIISATKILFRLQHPLLETTVGQSDTDWVEWQAIVTYVCCMMLGPLVDNRS